MNESLGSNSGSGSIHANKSINSEDISLKIFILGSCVSRDAFELSNSPELVDYRARTALGSSFAPRTAISDSVDLNLNPSPFQRRMVESDIEKLLSATLSSAQFDFLLLDLIDERLPMIRHGDSYITSSPELHACGLKPSPEDLVEVGSEEYLCAFRAGIANLISVVPAERIIVNEVYWATRTSDGVEIGSQPWTAKNNAILKTLYNELRLQKGISFISYPESSFAADPDHKWGVSPFHYGVQLAKQTIDGIYNVARMHRD